VNLAARRVLTALSFAGIALTGALAVHADQAPASAPSAPSAPAPAADAAKAPDHVQVQHVLIGFSGSVPGKNITRTKPEAMKLAGEIVARAKKGEDFGGLVKANTDDAFPGIYGMCNNGVAPTQGEFPRSRMVKGFGDVAFGLKVGEIGVAEYDPQASPFGWHIVKRLK
jgi:parvulin-like peptidyl-prolyl isomerase